MPERLREVAWLVLERPVPRRGLIRGAAATVGVSALGVLAGCSTLAKNPTPSKGPAPIVLVYAPWAQWPEIGSDWEKFVQPGLDYFQSQPANKGIQIKLSAPGGGGNFASQIAAGTGPDVFEDWVLAPYLNPNLVMNLDKYMQQDGVNAKIWSPGQMHALTLDTGTYFVPCYVHVDTMVVNLSNLDAMGLPYPDPEWDYTAAQAAFKAATTTVNGKAYFGFSPDFNGTSLGQSNNDTRAYALHCFGGALMDDTRMTCTIDSPQAAQAIQWWDSLHWDGLVGTGGITGNTTYQEYGSNGLLQAFENWGDSFKWTFFPVPKYPNGQFSFEATDYHAINAATKYPEQSWLFLKFLSAEPYWSQYCMKYLLRTPSLVSLWDQFESVVEQVTPLAKQVGIQYYTQAAQSWGLAGRTFQYEHAQAISIVNQALAQAMQNKGQDPTPVLTAAAQAVNALVAQGAQVAAKASGTSSSSSGASSSSSASGSSSAASSVSKA